jgi:hypothetical protein
MSRSRTLASAEVAIETIMEAMCTGTETAALMEAAAKQTYGKKYSATTLLLGRVARRSVAERGARRHRLDHEERHGGADGAGQEHEIDRRALA